MKTSSHKKKILTYCFFGSSHVLNGIYPMDLWNNYGIVSYNMGNSSERMATTYYQIQLARQYTDPKLIVLDTYYIYPQEKLDENKSKLHTTLDPYPISKLKYDAVKDLFDNKDILENQIDFLIPFTMYHSRWSELKDTDLKLEKNYQKGADAIIDIAEPIKTPKFEDVKPYSDEETINMEYLKKILEHCKENNLEILVIYLPHTATEKYVAQSKYVQNVCDEYEVDYLNFLNIPDVINYNIDFKDSSEDNSHLNPSGARKLTNYLGKYIKEHYDIPDQRNNTEYSFWNEDYNEYVDYKIKKLSHHEEELNNYLMLLYGEQDINYKIELSSTVNTESESIFKKLLENINNNYEINDKVFKNDKEHKDSVIKITTWDNRNGKVINEIWF